MCRHKKTYNNSMTVDILKVISTSLPQYLSHEVSIQVGNHLNQWFVVRRRFKNDLYVDRNDYEYIEHKTECRRQRRCHSWIGFSKVQSIFKFLPLATLVIPVFRLRVSFKTGILSFLLVLPVELVAQWQLLTKGVLLKTDKKLSFGCLVYRTRMQNGFYRVVFLHFSYWLHSLLTIIKIIGK